jgi:hypothetical protein
MDGGCSSSRRESVDELGGSGRVGFGLGRVPCVGSRARVRQLASFAPGESGAKGHKVMNRCSIVHRLALLRSKVNPRPLTLLCPSAALVASALHPFDLGFCLWVCVGGGRILAKLGGRRGAAHAKGCNF